MGYAKLTSNDIGNHSGPVLDCRIWLQDTGLQILKVLGKKVPRYVYLEGQGD